jgi:hypothetical protein
MSKNKKLKIRFRLGTLLTAVAFIIGIVTPVFFYSSSAFAATGGQITARSIQMSSATPGATGVSYTLTFTPVTSETSGELIVDFCGDTPIIGATCAFSAATVPNVSGVTASVGTVSTVGTGTPVHTIDLTGLTLTAGTAFSVTFGGISNPTSATSFYARILTYATGGSSSYVPASTSGGTTTVGSDVDYGGDALSTANNISISATVMEQLTFCISGTSLLNSTCSSSTSPNLTLGSGSPAVLSTSADSTGSVYTQVSTNALNGVVVNLKALNSCSGLSSNGGTSCGIPGIGSFAAAPAAGTAFFGLNVGTSTNNTTGGQGTITPNSNYGSTSGDYGMGSVTGNDVNSTYGAPIESSTGPCAFTNNTLTFAAQAANTTPAGIYTANESLIATGTF